MSDSALYQLGPSDLDTVIATAELERRPSRASNTALEIAALVKLQHELAQDPQRFFNRLVHTTLTLSKAGSAGISLLNDTEQYFVWPAVAGPLAPFVGEGTPRDFGPCGTVLDRRATLLMQQPARHFAYLSAIQPPVEEALLIPFYFRGKAVGTIWAVHHSCAETFDAEDRRVLESLSAFAASAYQTLSDAGLLEPFLRKRSW